MKHSFFSYTVLRPWLWRWHRRAGLVAAIVLVLVTVTGVFLNHTSEFALARKFVAQPWLLSFYGVPEPKIRSFQLTGGVVSSVDEGLLFWDELPLVSCQSSLKGAVELGSGFVVACAEALLLFDKNGVLLDRISATFGIPLPVERIGTCGTQLCLQIENTLFEADIQRLTFARMQWDEPDWSRPVPLPDSLHEPIHAAAGRHALSWEKVLLDLHSGRFFGSFGVWVVDIAGVLLLFLALSGAALWVQRLAKKTR